MTGFLSLVTYSPLIGVAVILIMKAFGKADDQTVKWIALVTTVVTLALSVILVARFDPNVPGFQFVEAVPWFAGLLTYALVAWF